MADEIAQVCELEMQGIKMVVKGGVEVGAFILRALKAMLNKTDEVAKSVHEKKLNKAGRKTFQEILEISNGNPPQALSIREADYEKTLELATKQGLHFHEAVDFIPNDGMRPIIIPAQEAGLWGQIYKAVASTRLEEDQKTVSSYDKMIDEEMEKLANCTAEKQQMEKEIQTKIENLKQAKAEAAQWVDYGKDVIEKDNVTMSLQDYLKQAKGTDFEKNPEVAMAENEKGVEFGAPISAKECFQPIRDKSLMPESKLMFYVPEAGVVVTREFKLDEQTGLVFSNYSLKSDSGEIFTCSDRNLTREEWNQKVLPEILDKAGTLEETKCRAFDNEEKLNRYLTYHGKVPSPSKEKVEEAIKSDKDVFTQAEAKDEVINFVSEQSKGFASADVTNSEVEIVCRPEQLTRDKGLLRLKLSEDESIVFSKTDNESLAGDGLVKFSVSDASKATFVKSNERTVTGISITPAEVKNKVTETLGEGAASLTYRTTAKR